MGRSGVVVYDAIKGAVVSVKKSMAREFVDEGIRVNAIAPGYIITEMHFANRPDPEARKRELEESEYNGCIMGRRRTGRIKRGFQRPAGNGNLVWVQYLYSRGIPDCGSKLRDRPVAQ